MLLHYEKPKIDTILQINMYKLLTKLKSTYDYIEL